MERRSAKKSEKDDGHYNELPLEIQEKLKCKHCGCISREWVSYYSKGPQGGGYYRCAQCKTPVVAF